MSTAQQEVAVRAARNYSNSPRNITQILSDGAWHGRRCFILGGGESLKGFNFSRLDGELTIGINKSFFYYDSSLLFFGDASFYESIERDPILKERWDKFPTPKLGLVSEEPGKIFHDVYVIRRTRNPSLPTSLSEGINLWNNSGYAALVLAYLLGANPIYLLGYDMKCVSSTHWHCGYSGQSIESQNSKMHSYMMPFIVTADDFISRGIDIVNLNPASALSCFKFSTIDNIL